MKNFIGKEQAAKLLDVQVATLELWVFQKFGPKPTWVGKVLRFDKEAVETFAKKLLLKGIGKKPHSPIKKLR